MVIGSTPTMHRSLPSPPSVRSIPAVLIVPATICFLTYGVIAWGGFNEPQARFLAASAAGVTVLAAFARGALREAPRAFFVVLLGGLIVSAAAAASPSTAAKSFWTLLVLFAAMGAGRALRVRHEHRPVLAFVAGLSAISGLAGVVAVAERIVPVATPIGGVWRGAGTLGYANASAALFVAGIGAACALHPVGRPAIARVAAYLSMAGLATTLSRGGFVNVTLAAVAFASLGGRQARAALRSLARPAVAAVVAGAVCAASASATHGSAVPILVALAGIPAVAMPVRDTKRWRRGLVAVATAGGVALACFAAASPSVRSRAVSLVQERAGHGADNRTPLWVEAYRVWRAHPVFGVGPGSYGVLEHVGRFPAVRLYAHNEYLQVAAETGTLGLISVVAALASGFLWWRRRRPGARRLEWAAAAAVAAGFGAQSAFDFLWRFPGLVAVVGLVVASLVPIVGEES